MPSRIISALAALALTSNAALAQQPLPRSVSNPGVITTQQRVTPAGAQMVFDTRVHDVAFGRSSDELWVLSGLRVFRVSWSDNRILERHVAPGSPAPQGLAVDRSTGRPIVSHTGRARSSGGTETTDGAPAPVVTVVRLSVADSGADSLKVLSDRLGKSAAGSPAVAAREDPQGHRIAAVPLTFDDSVAVIDVKTGAVLRKAPTGIAPFAAAVDSIGSVAYVSNWGGRRAKPGERTSPTGVAKDADQVVVDARGIASTGTVTRVDLVTGRATHTIAVGLHPTAILWDEPRHRVYVADGNSDAVSEIDAERNTVARTIAIAPFRDRTPGLAPTALALAPDGATLYVALGGINAVAVVNGATGVVRGLIPTGWYPSSIGLSADGQHLAIGALLGVGSGTASEELASRDRELVAGKGYVHANRGSVSVVRVPSDAELTAFTAVVASNNRLALASQSASPVLLGPRAGVQARAVPERHGEPSLVDHVVFIIKENRTYDQVFGDIKKGNGDPSLAIYPDSVTPNHHRLAEEFVLLDNFYATGGNSGDGHQWVTQANETDYAMWPGYAGRSYPFDGADPIAPASGGFLWDAALAKGKTATVFGEYAGTMPPSEQGKRLANFAKYRAGFDFSDAFHITAPNHKLNTILAHDYPSYGGTVPDVVRAQIFAKHVAEWERAGAMPNLVLVQLPSDHTGGTSPGYTTPAACLADNDLALGKIVEALTKSQFWKSMAIFVVEDDAQGGVDHVDGHRTVALAISPFTRRGTVDHTMYAQQGMLKTMELMLGLRPLSVFDLVATDMRASFIAPGDAPVLASYTAVEPRIAVDQANPPASTLRGQQRDDALSSARMNFVEPDAAPSDKLNRILWRAAKGVSAPYPAARHSLFFPMTVDLADEDREDRAGRGRIGPRPDHKQP
jgi:YVTN family beta-propeller protein